MQLSLQSARRHHREGDAGKSRFFFRKSRLFPVCSFFPPVGKVTDFSRPCLSVVGDKHKGFLHPPSVLILKADTAPPGRHLPTSEKYDMSDLLKGFMSLWATWVLIQAHRRT